jgi:hypothetical protein
MLQSEGMTVECVFDPTYILKVMGSFSPELPRCFLSSIGIMIHWLCKSGIIGRLGNKTFGVPYTNV